MFTIENIRGAHSKVKSGADFPAYIQELKALGIASYEHFVSDGHINYNGSNDFSLKANGKWAPMNVSDSGSPTGLNEALSIHQNGHTDYPTFCKQAAEAGVERWIVDMQTMKCTYYDKAGNELLAEEIPAP